ncbi:Vegetative incompatibility protein HET-E-1 [Teratosphaeria destructans]|uniref:Vegetative incompatibility protein HET-E-1 n=1 Tax=Teratosphaeria destructans TaxID=418781 RepID=A0A9W7SVS4_9PEZI|nr:Vegetative incompatibility protein HET-E-1 [Teratosphaeria destructans]
MRLLKTGPYIPGQEKLEIIQIWGKDVPSDYAILSHRWSRNPDDEVLLQDVQNGTSHTKPAFQKVMKAIERARIADGYQWLWIDTCCIDKSSSVELSEAINSMYTYYKNAKKCYAYLNDVSTNNDGSEFQNSAWWSRGWTLQELLAPERVEFYTSSWELLGTKSGLSAVISEKTHIEEDYLAGILPVQHASIAKRMSWAAPRQTTREEDLAYCLLGIFEVNMAMLYGEGERQAFMRLQEEIMKTSEDQSIFAWIEADDSASASSTCHGLLADKPKCFAHTGSTISYSELGDYNPSIMTARGLHTTLPLTQKPDGSYIATLSCPVSSRGYNDYLAVYLQRLLGSSNQFARVNCSKLASVTEPGKPQALYVRQNFPNFTTRPIYPSHSFQIHSLQVHTDHPELQTYRIVHAVHSPFGTPEPHQPPQPLLTPQKPWTDVPLIYKMDKTPGALTVALQLRRPHDAESFILMLGAGTDLDTVGVDARSLDAGSLEQMQKVFVPRAPGAWMETALHRVRVDVQARVRAGQKVYLVAVEVDALPRPPTVMAVLGDVADLVVPPVFGTERFATRAGVADKVRRLWSR